MADKPKTDETRGRAATGESEFPVLYLNPAMGAGGLLREPRLKPFSDHLKIELIVPKLLEISDPIAELLRAHAHGIVFAINGGLPDIDQVRIVEQVLSLHRRVWFHWPGEGSVEAIDRERLQSYRRHVIAAILWKSVQPVAHLAHKVLTTLARARPDETDSVARRCEAQLDQIIAGAKPALLEATAVPSETSRLRGIAAYLRTDYWAPLTSGGSYGHTCYVALSLSRTVEHIVVMTPSHYPLLDDLGLDEAVLPAPPRPYSNERDLLEANEHYYAVLKSAFELERPRFIYERLCLGNYCGARLSQEFGIPYIVEYNGSEIEMSRSFGGHVLRYESVYLKAELAAFRQAAAISVVSQPIKDDLIARGIPAAKILVNPNGVDPKAYEPPADLERTTIRDELGFAPDDCVVGFTGTFGGWHGIDVLAAAIPEVCRSTPKVHFLLIGDGGHKHLVNTAVTEHGLQNRVISKGRVPQQEGARLLRACDLYVSPHSSVMTSGRFFGSPTKLFEYMAMARGIIASDLDQIGEVLSPALRVADLKDSRTVVDRQLAVLCKPGDVSEFVAAVKYLADHRELAAELGRNARAAVLSHHTWDRHVQRLWEFIYDKTSVGPATESSSPPAFTNACEFSQTLRSKWDEMAVRRNGSPKCTPHTLEWYLEAETERYKRAPWITDIFPFRALAGKSVLEIQTGLGLDLCQFAKYGADVSGLDRSPANLVLTEENFRLRDLTAVLKLQKENASLPFDDNQFDLVYSSRTAVDNAGNLAAEILRILKPGGNVVLVVPAENSLFYWYVQFFRLGLVSGQLQQFSMREMLLRNGDQEENNGAVYTRERLKHIFSSFESLHFFQRELLWTDFPGGLSWLSRQALEPLLGRRLVLVASRKA